MSVCVHAFMYMCMHVHACVCVGFLLVSVLACYNMDDLSYSLLLIILGTLFNPLS